MPKEKDIWNSIITSLRSHVSQSELKTWFSHTKLRTLDPSLAVIEVPNKFFATWLLDNYADKIKNSFRNTLHFQPEIRFDYRGASATHNSVDSEKAKQSIPTTAYGLSPLWTFDSFIRAESNRFAYSSALNVATSPATSYNPLYIFSKLSLGKSHLLHAIGNHLHATHPRLKVNYLPSDRFTKEFSLARKSQKIRQIRQYYSDLSLFMLDDIHLLQGREKTQEQFISVFDSLYQSKKQIVITGKTPPNQMENLLPQLKSRLEWGLIAEIHEYDQDTKIKIVKEKAKEQNFIIPDDVTFFLVNATKDLKTLIHHLVSLQTYTSLYQRQVDMSIAKSVIKSKLSYKTSVSDIQKVTAEHFNISISDLLSDKKKRKFSYPRQLAIYLSRTLTELSFNDIAKAFGNKDHSTVIYSVKRIQNAKEINERVLNDIIKLQSFLTTPRMDKTQGSP
jgi:chromosomal replication initiator protein